MNNRPVVIILFLLSLAVACAAPNVEPGDSLLRLNPLIAYNDSLTGEYKTQYDYIDFTDNIIHKNGADWQYIYRLIDDIDSTTLNIVHIGDSHIQADIFTGHVRWLLQQRYGNAGRGLIVPFKMAGTNEPRDYSITGEGRWSSSKIMKQPWHCPMGFTGIAVTPFGNRAAMTVSTLSRDKARPFASVRIHKRGDIIIDSLSRPLCDTCAITYDDDYIELHLKDTTSRLHLGFTIQKPASLLGFELANDTPGVIYHAIGNNGATFENYNNIPGFASQISGLSPDIIILSLGANEAFGRITADSFRRSVDTLVRSLAQSNPGAVLLLTTPMECQRRRYVKRKGRRRRRTYVVNDKITVLRDVLLSYARDNGIAVYDWYDIAGGRGASAKWLDDNLLSRDRIHSTAKGYELQGTLFFEALINDIKDNR